MRAPGFWQSRFPAVLLYPLSWLFGALAGGRRLAYRRGWLKPVRVAAPVVVVGNLGAGGAGKTPTVRLLAEGLRALGWRVGIVSRGYGGQVRGVAEVPPDGAAARFGDEPVLLKRTSLCPVFVGRDRVAAARALLAAYPDTGVILTDDGLQHYRLARDVEIVVVDGERGFGNGWLLPAGPLREPISRLRSAHALVVNGMASASLPAHPHTFAMRLAPGAAWRLSNLAMQRDLSSFRGDLVHAVAGIAHPARFFAMLRAAGLSLAEHAFPDHHSYGQGDVAALCGNVVLTTEKDAVKLSALPHDGNIWVVPVSARIAPDLVGWVDARLSGAVTNERSPSG